MRSRKLFLALCVLFTGVFFVACNNISKPISANLIGEWTMAKVYEKQDGKWQERGLAEGVDQTILFREDSVAVVTRTNPKGEVSVLEFKWWANDKECTVMMDETVSQVLRLTKSEYEVSFNEALSMETGKVINSEFRWIFCRSK